MKKSNIHSLEEARKKRAPSIQMDEPIDTSNVFDTNDLVLDISDLVFDADNITEDTIILTTEDTVQE